MFPRIPGCILTLATLLCATHAAAETDVEACYGGTVDVEFQLIAKAGATPQPYILTLPAPRTWFIGQHRLNNVPCQPEPIKTSMVTRGFIEPRLEQANGSEISGSSATSAIRYLRISQTDPTLFPDAFQLRKIDQFKEIGIERDGGFRQVLPKNKQQGIKKSQGGFQFPPEYTTPLGAPMIVSCPSSVCTAKYRLEHNIAVSYRFFSAGKYGPQWIDMDTALRDAIKSRVHLPAAN